MAAFHRKHYVTLARGVIAPIKDPHIRGEVAHKMAIFFRGDNPHFQRGLWMAACNVEDPPKEWPCLLCEGEGVVDGGVDGQECPDCWGEGTIPPE
jgi:hypothetical protein